MYIFIFNSLYVFHPLYKDESGDEDEDEEENVPEEPSPQPKFFLKTKKLSARDGNLTFSLFFFLFFFLFLIRQKLKF